MANSLLEFETVLPPLLEQQISPPHRIVAQHLEYLQKWREYLLLICTGDSDENIDKVNIQHSVDDLLSVIMLIDFVGQSYPATIPTLGEILKIVTKPTAFSLCDAVYSRTSCKLLKTVFNPGHFNSPAMLPRKDIELSSLTNISQAVKTLYGSRMPITILGNFYQMCLDYPVADKKTLKKDSARRGKGIYYTPAAMVDYLVFHTLKEAFHNLAPEKIMYRRILDPSCGYGAFLVASFRFILKWLKNDCDNKRTSCHSLQRSLELLETMIYGTDIDERAVHWTRKLLLLTCWDFYINESVSSDDIRNLRIPTLEKNIVCADFLEGQSLKNETFHVIVGGPPFVRVQKLYKSDVAKVNNYKRIFRTAKNGQFDLYMLFIEKAIALLAEQGYLSMSISNTFLRSESGRTLRKLIAEKCAVSEIVEFEDSKLYVNALVQITAIMLRKIAEKSTTKYVLVKGRGNLRTKLSGIDKQKNNEFLQICNLPVIACASENWNLQSESEANVLHKIESMGIPLGKLPIHIRFGAATGADNVFLLKNVDYLNAKTVLAESRLLNDVFIFESLGLRPLLRGRHIKGYAAPEPETMCIFPYDKTGNLLTEDVLQTEFPRIYKYLKCCQPQLSSRKLKRGQPWYAFRSEEISGVIKSPKIITSVVNSGGGFAFDQHQHLFCNNSVVLIYPDEKVISPYFLLAVLNSKVFQAWAQYRMPTLGSGWYSYRISVLGKFPIPVPLHKQKKSLFDEIVNLAAKLLNKELGETNRKAVLSSIDNLVGVLYGISQNELLQ